MAKKIIKAQMKQRQDTKANWAAANPVLLDGELGMVSDDHNLYKVGDGRTAWNDLPFRGFDGTLAQELGTSANAAISQKAVTERFTELSKDISSQIFESGNVSGDEEVNNEIVSRSNFIICKKNDVISGNIYRIKMFDSSFRYIDEVIPNPSDAYSMTTITNENCHYVRVIILNSLWDGSPIFVNGVNVQYLFEKEYWHESRKKNEEISENTFKIQSVADGFTIPLTTAYSDVPFPTTIKKGVRILDFVGTSGIYLRKADDKTAFFVDSSELPYTLRDDVIAVQSIADNKGYVVVESMINSAIAGYDITPELEPLRAQVERVQFPLKGVAWESMTFPSTIYAGRQITQITGTPGIYVTSASGKNLYIETSDLPYILKEDIVSFHAISDGAGYIEVDSLSNGIEPIVKDSVFINLLNKYNWGGNNAPDVSELYTHTWMIPCKCGDIVKGEFYELAVHDRYRNRIRSYASTTELTINDANAAYVVFTLTKRFNAINELLINEVPILLHTINHYTFGGMEVPAIYPYRSLNLSGVNSEQGELIVGLEQRTDIQGAILGLWIKKKKDNCTYHLTAFRYRQVSSDWGNTEYSQIRIIEKAENGSTRFIDVLDDVTSQSVNDTLQVFDSKECILYIDWRKVTKGVGVATLASPYNEVDSIVFNEKNTIALMTLGGGNTGGSETKANLSANPYIALPIPQLAIVNIVAGSLPTTKTDDILATLEFNDMQGNVFAKKIIMNAQGTSSLGLPKKNISIDIVDENYEDSHKIKFGGWVAQDGYHLKGYMLDGIRVKPMACYDFYESMLLARGVRKDRAWKRLQLPSDIPMASNAIVDSYLQLDDGAKNHPSGFPIILYFNGVFHGIYCWQLKKHRANYHQKKSNAEHIHLDGNISNVLLWEANGVLDWDKWAGKKQESETSANVDGIEVRNPKKLILTNGTEYDADTNAGELISKNSARYDATNADMVRTASVRASIESLSRRVYALIQMSKGADKKTAIAEVFDVDSIIDYIIFSQITGNIDGYKKNWQWVTYDGVKWAVNAYDLDGTWGWSSWSYYSPYTSWIGNDTPPVTLVIENYLDEIKARYKELRDKGVIDLAKIMQPLVNYVKVIGIDYYDMEFEKWTDGERDNLWRFEAWMEESIKRTDVLMDYNKAA